MASLVEVVARAYPPIASRAAAPGGLTRAARPRRAARPPAGVDDPVGRHPALLGPLAAVGLPVQLTGRVGVGVDREQAAGLDRQPTAAASAGPAAPAGELISTATPNRSHAANTSSASNCDSPAACPRSPGRRAGRCSARARRCAGWRRRSTIRRGHRLASILSLECTRRRRRRAGASSSSAWSSEPSSRMSTSMPVSSRNGASSSLSRRDHVELLAQPLRRQPVGHRQPRRVVGEHQYSWPRSRAVRAISSIGLPPSDQSRVGVQVAAQRGPQLRAAVGDRPGGRRLELGRGSPAPRPRRPASPPRPSWHRRP